MQASSILITVPSGQMLFFSTMAGMSSPSVCGFAPCRCSTLRLGWLRRCCSFSVDSTAVLSSVGVSKASGLFLMSSGIPESEPSPDNALSAVMAMCPSTSGASLVKSCVVNGLAWCVWRSKKVFKKRLG